MIFSEEFFGSELDNVYEASKLRIHFDSLLEVSVNTVGFIEECRLVCPVKRTRLKVSTIFKYQEEGYKIIYDDKYLEDVFLLINLYNKKLEIDHSQNRFLHMKPIQKPLEYILFKMRRNPKKYSAFLKDAKIEGNPFNSPNEEREKRLNISSSDYIEQMKQEELAKSNKLSWEEMEQAKSYMKKFMNEFKKVNNLGKLGDVDLRKIKSIKNNITNDDDLPEYD